MEAGRRAFLLGRRPPETPWAAFLRRLRRACEGELREIGAAPAAGGAAASASACDAAGAAATVATATAAGAGMTGAARWRPASLADVRMARGLCAEYGVALALAGTRGEAPGRPCLWVDPRALDALQCLDAASSSPPPAAAPASEPASAPGSSPAPAARWRAGPGVTLAMLAQAGLPQFAALPGEMTVAAWLAGRAWAASRPGLACPPGLVSADVMLADGSLETLGPFGASGGLPLRSATGQALIPALYTLSARGGTDWCRAQAAWPARYRLDALAPPAPAEANLAGLLAGSEGALAWVESVVLQAAAPAGADPAVPVLAAPAYPAQARALDAHVKDYFDPAGLYPDAPPP